jgi:hypothetical protein
MGYPHTSTGERTFWASGELRAALIPTAINSLLSLQGFRLAFIETTTQRLTLSGIRSGDLSHIPDQLLKRPVWDLADTMYQFQVGGLSLRSRLSPQDAFVFTLNAGRLWREEKYLKADTAHVIRSLIKAADPGAPQERFEELDLQAEDGDGNFYWATALQTCVERKLFITAGGILGLGPHTVREDDIVCFLFGGDVHFILRPADNGCHFLIGECFLQGLMHGQVIRIHEQCHLESVVFTLC